MTARALYCHHVVRSAGSDGNTEWTEIADLVVPSSSASVEGVFVAGKHQNEQDEYPVHPAFTFRAQRDAPTYTKLEWLFYRIFCSHSAHKVTLRRIYTKTIPTRVWGSLT